MNTLATFIVLAFTATITNAQEIIALDEAKVESPAKYSEISRSGDQFSVNIEEDYLGEFEQDPMGFVEKNFDIHKFLAWAQNRKIDACKVSFKTRKGKLDAHYNREGELVRSKFKFKSIDLPYALKQKIYRDNKGWTLVKSTYSGKESAGRDRSSFYRITMQYGKEKRRYKINAASIDTTGIAHLD